MTEEPTKALTVKVSFAIKEYLAAKAKAGFRTINREIAMRLEESCARELAKPPASGMHGDDHINATAVQVQFGKTNHGVQGRLAAPRGKSKEAA